MKEINSVNIGKLMRKYSELRVSPEAVKAMIDRIDMFLEKSQTRIDDIAIKRKVKTIQACDVDIYFNFPAYDIENFINETGWQMIKLKKPSDVNKLHNMMEEIFG